ncbi:SDR family NAD(P)-dependent oxidoreductase [Nocardia vinacea]|uniref:SDR family NAD(P)-dependent oxidoreductase n=1 Tax=Nocardia vinacea TaxID=96468 RepID=A0ABZ1YN38_9NOCA|nr:SDR family NAD(P)-dependent oxidoreductase [Nocardia vinacea]
MSSNLHGTRVAITGGARGIGRATAAAFLAAGARVAIGDVDTEEVAKTAAALAESTGGRVFGLTLDVTDAQSFDTFLDLAEAQLGGLDALVNNAGIMPTGRFLDEPIELADRTIDINLRGMLIGTKLAGRRFAARRRGHIVNVASVLGLVGTPGVATYCASKFAVVGLGAALHQELATDGVAVSTICPAFVNTQLIEGLTPNWLARRIGFVEPADVARAAVAAVASGRGGRRVVPALTGVTARVLSPLPENLANRIGRLLGTHDTIGKADTAKRAAYLDRVTGPRA